MFNLLLAIAAIVSPGASSAPSIPKNQLVTEVHVVKQDSTSLIVMATSNLKRENHLVSATFSAYFAQPIPGDGKNIDFLVSAETFDCEKPNTSSLSQVVAFDEKLQPPIFVTPYRDTPEWNVASPGKEGEVGRIKWKMACEGYEGHRSISNFKLHEDILHQYRSEINREGI